MSGQQMEFDDILGDKKKKVTGKKPLKKSVAAVEKLTVSKNVVVKEEQKLEKRKGVELEVPKLLVGIIVYLAVAGEEETILHPAMVLRVNDSGSVNVNVFYPGYMSYMEKVPFTGYKKVLGAVHWPVQL